MVVAVGLTVVEPLADVDVKVPGVIEMPFAPVTAQLSVVRAPELRLVGFATKEVIRGAWVPEDDVDSVVEPQPASPIQARGIRTSAQRFNPEERSLKVSPVLQNKVDESMRAPVRCRHD